ncbi:MAG TPA: hypothetical protein VM097_12850 [Mycobacteriales bacterium]|nr:hypothetical protein [Mycobacteriales bacterium]
MKRRRVLSSRTADRLVQGREVPDQPELTQLVAVMSALVPDSAPVPSERLARLLEQGPPVKPNALVPRIGVTRSSRPLRRLSLAGTAFAGLVLALASTNALPAPAQQVVSDVVEWVSPVEIPDGDDQPDPAPTRTREPAPRVVPTEAATPSPYGTPGPEESPDDDVTPEPADDGVSGEEPAEDPSEEPTDEPSDEFTEEPTDDPSEDDASEPYAPQSSYELSISPRR